MDSLTLPGHVKRTSLVSHSDFTSDYKPAVKPRQRNRRRNNHDDADDVDDSSKRRCVSTACIACRKRKSKCDGNTPACAACSQVYGTECIYDPNSDLRRKGVYKNDVDSLKTQRDSTLQTLVQAILNSSEEEVAALVREMRTCESLDTVAERLAAKENGGDGDTHEDGDSPNYEDWAQQGPTFETQLYGKMGDLRLDDGSVRYIGGTSNLIHLGQAAPRDSLPDELFPHTDNPHPITSWTNVTDDAELITHLLNMYFTWHYTYFTTLSKKLFYEDFHRGRPRPENRRQHIYCSPLLVNAILALGCHFSSHAGARADPHDSTTAGDHFFREAKRLVMANDEHEKPSLTTVQAFALMSVREAGCGREAKGWVYSGMAFRMAGDMGLNLDAHQLAADRSVSGDDEEEDARRLTFWGCYLFDKCWSNYLGRLPQLPTALATVPLPDVFPDEDAADWRPYTDAGFAPTAPAQPARTRTVARQIIKLCEISNDLMRNFYNPTDMEKSKGKAAELRKLSDIHTRLETWRRELPKELEPREGGLPNVLVMHMFFQLLFIHLFRPFLKYTQATSPLPATVSPRKLCTQAAAMISKLMRLYKRSHGLRQICNIAVYIAHSACTIHLLNLPEKNARRDIVHGVKHLEEIAEGWLGARRTLGILSALATKWKIELPEEAAVVLARADAKFGAYYHGESPSPAQSRRPSEQNDAHISVMAQWPAAPLLPDQSGHSFHASNGVPPRINNPNNASLSGNSNYTTKHSTGHTNLPPVAATATSNNQSRRSISLSLGSMPPPPLDAAAMRARPHPSAATTPDASSRHHPSRGRSGETATSSSTAGNSPSDMFGGIDQLLREGQSWTYHDQASLAHGFGNWGDVSSGGGGFELDPSAWNLPNELGGGGGGGDGRHTSIGGPVGGGSSQPRYQASDGHGLVLARQTAAAGGNMTHQRQAMSGEAAADNGLMPWLEEMHRSGGGTNLYDEHEWYQ